ncbi:hypothetical protein KDM41_10160 [bacterium]|nr:hypothetical protein [bacterium]
MNHLPPSPRRTLPVPLVLALALVAASSARAAGVTFTAADPGAVVPSGALHTIDTVIRNTGALPDTFTVRVVDARPAAWAISLCEGAFCYPPYVAEISVPLAPGADSVMEVDVFPGSVATGCPFSISVTSGRDPLVAAELDFNVVTPGADVLVVTDAADVDGSACVAAAAAAGRTALLWRRHRPGPLASAEMALVGKILWCTAPDGAGITATDFGPLAYHVQHGGRIAFWGQNLVSAACDPASPHWSAQGVAWFDLVLGTGWAASAGGDGTVVGVPGDALGDGYWGGLAAACDAPDILAAAGGDICLRHGDGTPAAVRGFYGTGRTVTVAFAPGELATAGARDALVAAVLDWFDTPAAAPLPGSDSRFALAPNPGNPRTVISWSRARAGQLRISLHDVAGRRIAVLHDGPAPASGRTTWSGRDAAGRDVPSGIYLCRIVEADGRATVRKLTLVR